MAFNTFNISPNYHALSSFPKRGFTMRRFFRSGKSVQSSTATPKHEGGDDSQPRPSTSEAKGPVRKAGVWSTDVPFDERELLQLIDGQSNLSTLRTIPVKEVWHLPEGVRIIIRFNDLRQPIRKGGDLLIRFIGEVAKTGRFCPLGVRDWRTMNDQYKAEAIEVIRGKFSMPSDVLIDKSILQHLGKMCRGYKTSLKAQYRQGNKTEAEVIATVPRGVNRDQWITLVHFWFSPQGKEKSKCGKEARAKQNQFHTAGSTSYANKRDSFDTAREIVEARLGSSSRPRSEIEEEVFAELIYEQENPGYRAVGYGFGVKRSDIYGVRGELKKKGLDRTGDHVELQNIKIELANVKQQMRRLLPIYDAVSSGQASYEMIAEGRAIITAVADPGRDKSGSGDGEPSNFFASPSTLSSFG